MMTLQHSNMRLRILLLGALLAITTTSWSQYDFSRVNLKDINKDSIMFQIEDIQWSSGLDSLYSLLGYKEEMERDRRKNASFDLSYMSAQSSLENLNRDLAALGLPSLSETFGGIGFGAGVRGKRLVVAYHLVVGLKNKVSNADYTVDAERTSAALMFSYDVLNTPRVQLYPQLAVDFLDFEITSRRNAASTDIKDISGLILNPAGSNARKTAVALTYSGELDFKVLPGNGTGLILGFRYGYSMPLNDLGYQVNNEPSLFTTPGDKLWSSFWSVVVKFYIERS